MAKINRATLWVGISDGNERLLTSYQDGIEDEEVIPFDRWAVLIEREARAVGTEETLATYQLIENKWRADQGHDRDARLRYDVLAENKRIRGILNLPGPIEHHTYQVPPWPPSPESTYMLTRWKCSCGWVGPVTKDLRGNPALEIVRAQAVQHEQDPEGTP